MKFQARDLVKIPLVIAGLGLVVAWVILFFWSVDQKVNAHIQAGRAALEYLEEFDQVIKDSCEERDEAGARWVYLQRKDKSSLRLKDFVDQQKQIKDSSFVKMLQENQLVLDFIPVSSCRLWPEILSAP
jgi:hypothetical protein